MVVASRGKANKKSPTPSENGKPKPPTPDRVGVFDVVETRMLRVRNEGSDALLEAAAEDGEISLCLYGAQNTAIRIVAKGDGSAQVGIERNEIPFAALAIEPEGDGLLMVSDAAGEAAPRTQDDFDAIDDLMDWRNEQPIVLPSDAREFDSMVATMKRLYHSRFGALAVFTLRQWERMIDKPE